MHGTCHVGWRSFGTAARTFSACGNVQASHGRQAQEMGGFRPGAAKALTNRIPPAGSSSGGIAASGNRVIATGTATVWQIWQVLQLLQLSQLLQWSWAG